jgi:hypothetical protein
VVIDDLDFVCEPVPPFKTDSVLVVDPDTVLPHASAFQSFEVISWRAPEITELSRGSYHLKLSQGQSS